jgi:hypothetical protein
VANWPRFFREVRTICDENADGTVDLRMDEIIERAQSRDGNVNQRWWWDLMMNPNAASHTGVLENGMECEPLPEGRVVEHVVFKIVR